MSDDETSERVDQTHSNILLNQVTSDTVGETTTQTYHVTITPGEDNPDLGKYVCYIDHHSSEWVSKWVGEWVLLTYGRVDM